MRSALPREVSNITAGPLLPRASTLSDDGPVAGERVQVHERLGAVHAGLLGVGEQEHDVVAGRRAAPSSARAVSSSVETPAPSSLAP